MIAERKILNKPKQKLIYSKESNYNFSGGESSTHVSGDPSILGLFKTSSALGKSIRNQKDPSKTFYSNVKLPPISASKNASQTNLQNLSSKNLGRTFTKFPNTKLASLKTEANSNNLDIKIRNIIHDYTNIDVNDYTYNILTELRSKKREINLDSLDEYELWKSNFWKEKENEIKLKINKLKEDLNNTKDEIYSKFNMENNQLIELIQNDIDEIQKFYEKTLENRNNLIDKVENENNGILNNTLKTVNLKVKELSKQLDKIGYLKEEEIESLANNKNKYIEKLINNKKDYYKRIINEIKEDENEIVSKSKDDLIKFKLRWKNVKLNNYLDILKKLLNSKEFIDNNNRQELINKLKETQIEISNKKYNIIFNDLFNANFEQLTFKYIESLQKKFDDINNEADKLYTNYIENLMNNKKEIEDNEKNEINNFKNNVDTISYDFNVDNLNEKKYNDFEECKNIDDLINKEITPIIQKNESDRKFYIDNLNKYIEQYDEFLNNVSNKILSLFSEICKNNDEFKKNFNIDEKNYLINIAKECDNDDDICFNKEEELKKNLTEMKNCINKEELDKFLENSFKIMDELEVEYRDFFKKIDEIFNSHDGLIKESFKKYECSTLKYHGDYPEDQKFFIELRRNKESEFLSKKKQAELDEEERIKQEEEEKNAAESGKKAPAKKQDNKRKKNEK